MEQQLAAREKTISRASWLGVGANLLLVLFKFIAGSLSHSVAITADALNNLTDALSCVITLAGIKAASKNPDREHPFGHGRVEYVSSIAIGALILYTAVTAFTESVRRITNPEPVDYDATAIVVMVGSVAAKLLLARYYRNTGRATDSQALCASGADAFYDAVISGSVIAGGLIGEASGVRIDGWLGAVIAVIICINGLGILREGISSIIGERPPAALTGKLRDRITSFPSVDAVDDLVLHRYGPEHAMGAAHIVLPENMSVGEADAVCREIAQAVQDEFGIEMILGVYAANADTPRIEAMQKKLAHLAAAQPGVMQVHGFYANLHEHNISFDLILDFECPDPHVEVQKIVRSMEKSYPDYTYSVTIDRDIST